MNNENGLGNLSFLKEIAERAPQVVFAFDMDSLHFIYLNPAFEVIWNKTRESIYNDPAALLEAIHPEDKRYVKETFQKLLNGAEKKEVEFRILRPDKSVRWMFLIPLLIEEGEPGKRLIAGFLEDKTAARENQAYVQRFAAKKNSLLEILSHDLSGPLSNIQGLSSLLAKEIEEYNNPKLDKMIGMVAKTSERSIGMIREFIKQEFLESVNVELIRDRTNLVAMIRQIIDQYKTAEREIAKTFNLITSEEEIFAEVDEYKLNQVFNNLISNAIKFTHEGGLITIRIEERKEAVVITVADNGIGIPARYHEHLFEKFTKARRPGLKGEPSVGLGMSLIKTIVQWHNGRIWFESEENKGATFYIELPRDGFSPVSKPISLP